MTDPNAVANQQNTIQNTAFTPIDQLPSIEEIAKRYGDNFQVHLLYQYKLYVEMADRISVRRGQTNSFYISLLTGLLALISLVGDKKLLAESQSVVLLAVAILGLSLCFLWYSNIRSYKQLNSRKFKIIHEMEQHLPFPCYNKEQLLREKDMDSERYIRQTNIEQYVSFTLSLPYFGLLIYSIFSLFN